MICVLYVSFYKLLINFDFISNSNFVWIFFLLPSFLFVSFIIFLKVSPPKRLSHNIDY
jgi:hypothetical protein